VRPLVLILAALAISACSEARRPPGGGTPKRDASLDAGKEPAKDAEPGADAAIDRDAGFEDARRPMDASAPDAIGFDARPFDATPQDAIGFDAVSPDALALDAMTPDSGPGDAGFPDLGFIDAGPGAASAQIAQVRAAMDGPVGITIDGAIVTYVKTQRAGTDGPGFAVQADPMGPALWVSVDPATLSPQPAAGDRVRFTVITKTTDVTAIRFATEISGWTRIQSGSAQALIQDVSSAPDLVSNLEGYEVELVRLSGTIAASFHSAGARHQAARIDTAAISGDANLELRLPTVLNEQLGLSLGCTFASESPLWRFAQRAQAAAWIAGDLRSITCPPPRLVSAAAPRPDRLLLTFDRPISRTSVQSGGQQISLSGGLVASAAFATSNVIVVTTTRQSAGVGYTVTVAGTVTDVRGTALDPSFRTASFSGASPQAVVRINELNANITGGCDLIELRAVEGGTLDGWSIRSRDLVIATFSGLTVARNQYVVVHANGTSASCNAGSANETASTTAFPRANFPLNFDSAFDWFGAAGGIVNTDTVITLYDANGNIADAILAADDPTGLAASGSEDQAAIAAVYGEWTAPGGGIPLGGFEDDEFSANAITDLNGTAVDQSGPSLQRTDNNDSNSRLGWTDTNAATWGANNAGQQNF
jgi:hypothetical protein